MAEITPARTSGTFDASNNLLPRDVEAFVRNGVAADTLAGPVPVRVGLVHFDALGFEFDHHTNKEAGVRAYLFLILDHQGVARDVVDGLRNTSVLPRGSAGLGPWGRKTPSLLACRSIRPCRSGVPRSTGYGPGARVSASSDLRWPIHYLCDAAPLLAEDAAHGADLKHLLTRPAPRIIVPASQFKKAA